MGRPVKDNADYFTHDADMRDDPKIKALRRKFKVAGYGVWCMLLEAITDSDNFRLTVDLEIIAGDFDVETDFLQQVMQYCIQLDLLQTDEGCKTIWSKTLDNRFEALLSKRKRDRRELSPAKTPNVVVIASESTQSRVKESKVNTITADCLCSVFGKKYKPPEDRLRAEAGFYRDIDTQYVKLREVHNDERIIAQVTAYLKHCEATSRKRIGTAHKLADTILQSDWIVLTGSNLSPPVVVTSAYSAAERQRKEWTLEGWEDFYKQQLVTDNKFRKHFGYGELPRNTPMGSDIER